MPSKKKKKTKTPDRNHKLNQPTIPCAGQTAQAGPHTLTTMTVGCLPILNRLLERMKLEQFFRQHLKPDGSRTRLCTPRAFAANFFKDTKEVRFGKSGGLIEVEGVGFGFVHTRREVYDTIQKRLNLPSCNQRVRFRDGAFFPADDHSR